VNTIIDTIFGPLSFTINGRLIDITPIEMTNEYRHFQVDKRYQVRLSNVRQVGEETIIKCQVLSSNDCSFSPSTGEDLSLVVFNSPGKKMCIGTIGDLPGVIYKYPEYSLQMTISKEAECTSFIFLITWCDSQLADTDDAEFLADPSILTLLE